MIVVGILRVSFPFVNNVKDGYVLGVVVSFVFIPKILYELDIVIEGLWW